MLHLRPERSALPLVSSPASASVLPPNASRIPPRKVHASAIVPGEHLAAMSSARLTERRVDATRTGIPAPSSSRAVQAPLRRLLVTLSADEAQAHATLAGLGARFAMAAEPMVRRALTEEIAAAASQMPCTALRALCRELVERLGGPALDPGLLSQLVSELAGHASLDTARVEAITAGLGQGLGAPRLSDAHIDALLKPALAEDPGEWDGSKRDALVRALAELVAPQGTGRLQARLDASGQAPR